MNILKGNSMQMIDFVKEQM